MSYLNCNLEVLSQDTSTHPVTSSNYLFMIEKVEAKTTATPNPTIEPNLNLMRRRMMGLTSSHWGVYEFVVNEGRLSALQPFSEDSDPSWIGHSIIDLLDDKTRISAPVVRKSWLDNGPGTSTHKRGSDSFVQVDWEDAEKLVATELGRVIKTKGNKAIYAGSYGWASAGRFHHAQSQVHRFLNSIGGYTRSNNTYSFAAAEVIVPHILGSNLMDLLTLQTSWQSVCKHTDLMLAFGGLPLFNSQISNGGTGVYTKNGSIEHIQRAYGL